MNDSVPFCSIISALFDAPCAAISLIYDDTILAKSVKGPFTRCVEREGSICSYIIVPKEAKVLVVEDSTRDARFSNNPYVKGASSSFREIFSLSSAHYNCTN